MAFVPSGARSAKPNSVAGVVIPDSKLTREVTELVRDTESPLLFHHSRRVYYWGALTWWVNSGADFDPRNTVPVPAGGFVRRVAHTPHYDGVKESAAEPAVIGIFGIAPVDLKLVDPSRPGWRQV